MFYSIEPLEGWDGSFEGKECPIGVYYWELSYKVIGVDLELKTEGSVILSK